MNEQSTFDNENLPFRRDIMPKWLTIYMHGVIIFGIILLIIGSLQIVGSDASNAMANDPESGEQYRAGEAVGRVIPGILFMLMGLLVGLERRRAIRKKWEHGAVRGNFKF